MVHMVLTLVIAIAPIIFTLALGYFSGMRKQFDKSASQLFIEFVMTYALPLSLFGGLLSASRKVIIHDLPLFLWLGVGMIFIFILLIAVYCLLFKNLGLAVLRALSVACPSVPFMGTSVLAIIFGGTDSIILVAVCGLYLNLVQAPLSVLLLSLAKIQKKDTFGAENSAGKMLVNALKKPLVWAPIIGFALNLSGFHLEAKFLPLFSEVGQTAGGVALFSIGIMLYSQKFHLTLPVIINVLLKNIALPLVIWGAMVFFRENFRFQQMVVITLAIPTAAIPSMLAIQNHLHEDEITSTQLASTLLSVVTMSILLVLLQVR